MAVAETYSQRGTCSRLQVGAVIADARGVVLSSGYNGSLSGMPHCDHATDDPCRDAMHAEANAIAWAARRGVAVDGGILHCTHEPCNDCARLVVQAGISAVYYRHAYGRNSGVPLLHRASVPVERI